MSSLLTPGPNEPTIGRIVHVYRTDDAMWPHPYAAAIVVAVFADLRVDLQVFLDGPDGVRWMQNVSHRDSVDSTSTYYWTWPERTGT